MKLVAVGKARPIGIYGYPMGKINTLTDGMRVPGAATNRHHHVSYPWPLYVYLRRGAGAEQLSSE
jgi:hypothetical protein